MISTTAEYGLRAAVFLAQNDGAPQTTAQIAAATMVPIGYLAKIMQAMVRNGLVSSQRGLGGGFQLTRRPAEITVLDVLESVDSPVRRLEKCPLGLTSHTTLCPVHKLVDNAIQQVEEAFRKATLESLLKSTRGVKPLCDAADEIKKHITKK